MRKQRMQIKNYLRVMITLSGQSSMSGNVNVNKFDEVVEVGNNMTHRSTAHNIKTKPALIDRQKSTFDLSLSTWLHAHSYGRKDFLLKD